MKNTILFFVILFVLGACKDDSQPEPDAGVVYEDWKILPDSVIPHNQEIITIESRLNKIFVQTKSRIYVLDTNLVQLEIIASPTESGTYQTWGPKYGEQYALFRNEWSGLTIVDLNQPSDKSVTYKSNKLLFGDDVFNWHHSGLVNDNEFSVVSMVREGDKVFTKLTFFHIEHSSNSQSAINIILDNEMVLEAKNRPNNGWPSGDIRVFKNETLTIPITNRDYRAFDNDKLVSQHIYGMKNMFEYQGVLYAVGDTHTIVPSGGGFKFRGLFQSFDKGKTFNKHIENSEISEFDLTAFQFKIIGSELVGYGGGRQYFFDPSSGDRKTINVDGFGGFICIEKAATNVLASAGTGVYYKSWESFLNK